MNTIEAIRVLIVDDESLVRGVLKQILSQSLTSK
jgi:YesN/AraC family two-component response regulator